MATQPTALDTYLQRLPLTLDKIEALRQMASDHFGHGLDIVQWGHVSDPGLLLCLARSTHIKIVLDHGRCGLNVAAWGAVPHCHHHGYTLSPQGDHIVATILATRSTHCSHKVATLLPACRHTVDTVSRQPDLIAQMCCAISNFCWSQSPMPRYSLAWAQDKQ